MEKSAASAPSAGGVVISGGIQRFRVDAKRALQQKSWLYFVL